MQPAWLKRIICCILSCCERFALPALPNIFLANMGHIILPGLFYCHYWFQEQNYFFGREDDLSVIYAWSWQQKPRNIVKTRGSNFSKCKNMCSVSATLAATGYQVIAHTGVNGKPWPWPRATQEGFVSFFGVLTHVVICHLLITVKVKISQ